MSRRKVTTDKMRRAARATTVPELTESGSRGWDGPGAAKEPGNPRKVLVDRSHVTAEGHVWLCSAADSDDGIATIHRRWVKPGNERYTLCGFRSPDFESAYQHADEHAGAHYVYEHPDGNKDLKPRRSMHGSDSGGAYIDDVDGWQRDDRP